MLGTKRSGNNGVESQYLEPPFEHGLLDGQICGEGADEIHVAVWIDAAVEMLNLTPLKTSYYGVGKPAYCPVLLLKAVLYEHQRGRQSPAQWSRDIRENEPLRWLVRGYRPCRSTLYEFRDRCAPFLDDLNQEVLQIAQTMGMTTADRGALDGTTVAAHASRRHFGNEDLVCKRLAVLDEVDQGTAEKTPAWVARSPRGRDQQRRRYQEMIEVLDHRQKQNALRPSSKRKQAEKILASWNDPQAVIGRDKEQVYRPLYNMQILQDIDSPLIIAYGAFAQQNDAGTLQPMLERARQSLGHTPSTLLMDSGYLSGRELAACSLAGITLYAPWQANDFSEQKKGKKQKPQIPKSEFRWQSDRQEYLCPQGHPMPFSHLGSQRRTEGVVIPAQLFVCPPEHCKACPRKDACAPKSKTGRSISRLENEEYVEEHCARMATDDAKTLYRLRSQTVEPRFADIKEHRGLRRWTCLGLRRVQAQVAANVLTHNLLSVARYVKAKMRSIANPTVNAAAA